MSRKQFPLRIDPQLWAEIERLAAADLRSVNAEVEVLLRDAVRRRQGDAPAQGDSTGDRAPG